MQMYGCYVLSDLVLEMYIRIVACLAGCIQLSADKGKVECDGYAEVTSGWIQQRMMQIVESHKDSPMSKFVADKLEDTLNHLPHLEPTKALDQLSQWSFRWFEEMSDYIRWNTWQTLHWTWLQDSIHAKQVVHTTWGSIERWAQLGAHDATSMYNLTGSFPLYHISNMSSGMRWDIVRMLIKSLAIPEDIEIHMVEVGVFVGHLSKFILDDPEIPNVKLTGIDPYIGIDGSYPGNFSQEMQPDDPYIIAQALYNEYPGRAQLAPTTSAEVASLYPNNSVDIVFLDGCHLYHCIKEDLELWLPKVKPGGIIAGHDFSPQWPGVVLAVHEARRNRAVTLGMDWMYWWKKE
eukprot:GEMP01049347.1.p1 GENE.GEMP01049347.1~~GEMP01049347.1.p1  ORF type:complete len:348 (+),score=70.00 GEMP01049347.1:279-1322(+)